MQYNKEHFEERKFAILKINDSKKQSTVIKIQYYKFVQFFFSNYSISIIFNVKL